MITGSTRAFDPFARRSLRQALERVRTSTRRLSSGERITKAADDAAGLAIAEGLDSRARSRRAAIGNIGDGMNALAVADSGLSEIADLLKRARELAIQAASGALDGPSRALVQQEFDATLDSIDHVAYSTMWGNRPLLSKPQVDVGLIVDVSGSMGGEIAQVKASISSFVSDISAFDLDAGLGLAEMGPDSIDGVKLEAAVADPDFDDALDDLDIWGVSPMDPYSALLNASGVSDLPGENDPDSFAWRPGAQRKVLVLITDTGREAKYISTSESAVATKLEKAGIEVHTINPGSKNSTFDDIASQTGGSVWDIGGSTGSGIPAALAGIAATFADEDGLQEMEIQVDPTSGIAGRIAVAAPVDSTMRGLGVDELDVSTVSGATGALDTIDSALDTVNSARAAVGASHNRLEHALSYEEGALVQDEASESRIRDADMAREAAESAKAQILAQTTTTLMAQLRRAHRETLTTLLS
ncbi:MAG TPA: flagellin [Myxococcota bacterium]|nr:flagellin [Myxococcota bacterium]